MVAPGGGGNIGVNETMPSTAECSRSPSPPNAGALQAATGAFASSRRRATSTPTRQPVSAIESHYALSAADMSQRAQAAEAERQPQSPALDNLPPSLEASRIRYMADTNPERYTSVPPEAPAETEGDPRLQAAMASMSREVYPASASSSMAGEKNDQRAAHAVTAAQIGADRMRGQGTATEDPAEVSRRAVHLQNAAQRIASEKLATMNYEDLYHDYYGTGKQPLTARSLLPLRLRRNSSDASDSRIDAEQSRGIRRQMTNLHTSLSRLDERRQAEQEEKRQRDRDELMEIARRNVNATMDRMDSEVYANKGLPTPQQQKEWDEVARERVRLEVEGHPFPSLDRVRIGEHHYMDRDNVEAIARARLEPTLAEINERADDRRMREIEQQLDKEEAKRREARQRERDADTRAEEKRLKGEWDI